MSVVTMIINLSVPVLHHWGYWILFLAAMLEASPLFGLVVPGQSLVILGGFFAKLGILNIADTLLVAALGAILGDVIGYIIGRKYGSSFLTKYGKYFFFKKEYFEKTKKLMHHHVGKTLIIGRFHSLTRAFAPFVAGSSDIPLMKFLPYNILGGVSWAISFVLIGYVFGSSYKIASNIGSVIFIAILLSILLLYLSTSLNKRNLFTKYHLYLLLLHIFSLYLFSKMVEDVLDGELVTKADVWLSTKIVLLWNPLCNRIMVFITNIASPLSLVLLSLLLFSLLLSKKKWCHALLLLVGMAGGFLLETLVKLVMHRARPANALIEVSGYSFPSGHATMAIIFFSFLLYAFKEYIKKPFRYIFIATNILLFLLIGFSRLYLNVHWLSDVLAGFGLGLFWLTFLILLFHFITQKNKDHC